MTWPEIFNRMAEHYTALAMTPGCWQYAQARVAEMEQQQGGHWLGLRAEVGRRIKAAGFRPAPNDLAPFEREPQSLPQSLRRYGR